MNSSQIIILQGYLNLFWYFPINTLTAHPGSYNLNCCSFLKFCPTTINLISKNNQVYVMGETFLKIEEENSGKNPIQ
jgi:hypothetical protein